MLSPYQFSSNSPIYGKDFDGLEWSNFMSALKKQLFGVTALQKSNIQDAWSFTGGNVQEQFYRVNGTIDNQKFEKIKNTFITNPVEVLSNNEAKFSFDYRQNEKTITKGDIFSIDIKNSTTFDSHVIVDEFKVSKNEFTLKVSTLEGHIEAGSVTFSGSFDEKSGEFNFTISGTSRIDHAGANLFTQIARGNQKLSWTEVLQKITDMTGSETRETVKVREYEFDPKKQSGEGKFVNQTEEFFTAKPQNAGSTTNPKTGGSPTSNPNANTNTNTSGSSGTNSSGSTEKK